MLSKHKPYGSSNSYHTLVPPLLTHALLDELGLLDAIDLAEPDRETTDPGRDGCSVIGSAVPGREPVVGREALPGRDAVPGREGSFSSSDIVTPE